MSMALHHSSKVHTLGWEVYGLGVQQVAGIVCKVRSLMHCIPSHMYLYNCAIVLWLYCLVVMWHVDLHQYFSVYCASNVHKFHI